MSDGGLGWIVGFIGDPRWGIPMLLLTEAAVLWAAWNPRAPSNLGARRTSWSRPDGDPVSRMYYALGDQRYSVLVRWSRERIDELYEARYGSALPSLPWGFWRRDADLPEDRYRLRRLTLDLRSFEWEALEREHRTRIRWAFWRTAAREAAVYRGRVDRILGRAQSAISGLEAAG